MSVPEIRLRVLNDRSTRPDGAYVLYWMTAARRTRFNFALQRAVDHARALQRPLLVLEPLRVGYRWANDRIHAFIMHGMADNVRAMADAGVTYFPYVEPTPGAGKGLLAALARHASVVVTDEWPAFFFPHMQRAAAAQLDVRLEAVDGCGLHPLRSSDKAWPTAYAFRRFLQKTLPQHLVAMPRSEPLADLPPGRAEIPDDVLRRWPRADAALLAAQPASLRALPIDHDVPVVATRGGQDAARAQLQAFLPHKLARYVDDRSAPDLDGQSRLSPWLHQGHLSVHEVFTALAQQEDWTPARAGRTTNGGREGFWGMSAPAEAFLDELVTWRELGLNFAQHRDDIDRYSSLPDWARATLDEHTSDPRQHVYTHEQLENARTHDPLWNAAQRQLRREGVIHNYLRMLWGKKVLEWSRTPQEAVSTLIELNNRWAIDGRDPSSYSGIFWCVGRYDRPWGPIRPIFGAIRYMTSENTARKWPVKNYLKKYDADAGRSRMPLQPALL